VVKDARAQPASTIVQRIVSAVAEHRAGYPPNDDMTVVVRTAMGPMALVGPVRNELRVLDKNIAPDDIQTMETVVYESVSRERFAKFLQDIFGCSEDASRKMDIGTFVSGELDTSLGRVAMAEWKGYVMGILADAPAKKEDLNAAVERFVSLLSVG